MKNILSTLIIILFSIHAWSQTVDVFSFSELSANSGLNVHLIKSDNERVEVDMKKGDFKDLEIEVKNNKLKIKANTKGFWNLGSSVQADIDVYYKNIEELHASSGASIDSKESLSANKLEIDISSGASISLEIDANVLNVDISSGSDLILSGRADTQFIDISSGANYRARKLISNDIEISASSGSDATIYCTNQLKAASSSGADIDFYGNPKDQQLDSAKYSGGSISAKN